MNGTIRVFINGSGLDLPTGESVAQAVRVFDPDLALCLAHGSAFVTDGRGLEIDPATPLASGSILRVVVRARRGPDADS